MRILNYEYEEYPERTVDFRTLRRPSAYFRIDRLVVQDGEEGVTEDTINLGAREVPAHSPHGIVESDIERDLTT